MSNNLTTSLHNHTKWSDGVSTITEMIEGARRAGISELGISDHFAEAPAGRSYTWSIRRDQLDIYVAELEQAISATNDVTVRMGLEVDYFPETIDLIARIVSNYNFDFLIGSVHFVGEFPTDLDARYWEELPQESRDEMWKGYWKRIRMMAESGLFDFVGHFDVPKKYKYYPSIDLTEDALAALDSIAAADMAIEINTAGWDKPVQEAYPSLFYLQEAHRKKIPLIINADAHNAENVARNFDRAREFAQSAGYSRVVKYDKRKRIEIPL